MPRGEGVVGKEQPKKKIARPRWVPREINARRLTNGHDTVKENLAPARNCGNSLSLRALTEQRTRALEVFRRVDFD